MAVSDPFADTRSLLPSEPSRELDLVRKAQLGSASAFEALVQRRGGQLYRYLVVRLGNDADARDALQETLTAIWQGLPQLRDRERFWPWACGIGARKAADIRRRRSARSHVARLYADGETQRVHEALSALPDRHRRVLLLRYLLGLSEEEVAIALGVRVGTVKSRTARARRAFMEIWR